MTDVRFLSDQAVFERIARNLRNMRRVSLHQLIFEATAEIKNLDVCMMGSNEVTTVDLEVGDIIELHSLTENYAKLEKMANFIIKKGDDFYTLSVGVDHAHIWTGEKWDEAIQKIFDSSCEDDPEFGNWG